jgi:dihydroflavonol-4-reductase
MGLTVVTGGAGFIGSHLVERLVQSGEAVRVLERPGADVSHLPPEADVVFADVRDCRSVAPALRGARYVYHLAANPNLWAPDRSEFESVNYNGTVNVIEAALSAGAERVLHTSTESILTTDRGGGAIPEDVDLDLSDAIGPYCRSKLLAERAAMDRARAGRPVLIASPTMPVGPGDRRLTPPSRLIRDFCSGRIPARMDCTLNLIDVRDVALGLVRTMERGAPGRRYLLGAENLSLVEVLRYLGDICGIPVPWLKMPYCASLVFARASELLADHFTHAHPRATVTGVRLARRIMHFDNSRTLQELDLIPRPVPEALADAVQWMRVNGLLEIDERAALAAAAVSSGSAV